MKIQTNLMNKMRLVVDLSKSGGSGTSNDGKTSRRAFAEYQQTVEFLVKTFYSDFTLSW